MRFFLRRDSIIPAAALAAAGLFLTLPFLLSAPSYTGLPDKKEYSRIVSLSPSLSKIALDLGLENRIIGITSYDAAMRNKAAVVGTLINPNMEAIIALKPDAVFFCEEDSTVQHIEQLSAAGINPVFFPRIMTFSDALSSFVRFGSLAGKKETAEKKAALYLEEYSSRKVSLRKPLVLFLISNQPLIAASHSSFIGSLIADAGGISAASGDMNPYPIMSKEFAARANPDIIITAAPGGVSEIKDLFIRFKNLSFMKNDSIFAIDADTACLYDPADMSATGKQLLAIFKQWNTRL